MLENICKRQLLLTIISSEIRFIIHDKSGIVHKQTDKTKLSKSPQN